MFKNAIEYSSDSETRFDHTRGELFFLYIFFYFFDFSHQLLRDRKCFVIVGESDLFVLFEFFSKNQFVSFA